MEVIFVNNQKKERALEVLNLINGVKSAVTPDEQARANVWTRHLNDAKVNAKDEKAVQFVYEKMGGLIRTPEQQKAAEVKAEEMKKEGKKKKIDR